ncbi:GspH/FimT family pseudopilin [Halomonas sp. SSL-5]|uniref:GspH/FimT family pseudopilin n=1 Tax=Halomonas sp. SSL-5 TaxID=3065855 RepID=UPI002738C21E|nr:GspH/FimT family pseudopilin [Halomonas sp. SSL-5]MDY7117384.1 GspH/FimT family pseudopilin [Halomonas sp. SSL-5]
MRLAPPPCRGTRRTHTGLTLIELIVAITVAAILFTWAIPSFQRFSARNEVAAEVMRIRTALQLAKNTAVTRRRVIAVCPIASMSATKCEKYDWSLPIAIIDGHATAGDLTGVEILKVLEPSGGPSVTFNRDYPVRFQSTGWSRGHNGTFIICGKNSAASFITLSNMGKVTRGSEKKAC